MAWAQLAGAHGSQGVRRSVEINGMRGSGARSPTKLAANVRTPPKRNGMAASLIDARYLSWTAAMASLANPVVQRLFEGPQAINRRLDVLLRSACSVP